MEASPGNSPLQHTLIFPTTGYAVSARRSSVQQNSLASGGDSLRPPAPAADLIPVAAPHLAHLRRRGVPVLLEGPHSNTLYHHAVFAPRPIGSSRAKAWAPSATQRQMRNEHWTTRPAPQMPMTMSGRSSPRSSPRHQNLPTTPQAAVAASHSPRSCRHARPSSAPLVKTAWASPRAPPPSPQLMRAPAKQQPDAPPLTDALSIRRPMSARPSRSVREATL